MAINEKSTIHFTIGSQWALNKLTKHEIEQEYLCVYLNANEALTGGRTARKLMLRPKKPMASAWPCPTGKFYKPSEHSFPAQDETLKKLRLGHFQNQKHHNPGFPGCKE